MEILIVDDNPEDAELTLRALRQAQFADAVHVLQDGAEALDYLLDDARPLPRLVLLDLKLPKVGGLEVLARIKRHERLRTLPVVALTSSRETLDVQRAYRLGVNSYVVKPVSFERFVEAVSTVGQYWLVLNEPESRARVSLPDES